MKTKRWLLCGGLAAGLGAMLALPHICTLLGELVWKGSADSTRVAVWTGANRADMRVASDVYPILKVKDGQ